MLRPRDIADFQQGEIWRLFRCMLRHAVTEHLKAILSGDDYARARLDEVLKIYKIPDLLEQEIRELDRDEERYKTLYPSEQPDFIDELIGSLDIPGRPTEKETDHVV